MQKYKIWMVLSIVIICVAGLILWLMPQDKNIKQPVGPAAASGLLPQQTVLTQAQVKAGIPYLSPSQKDTEINCQLRLDSSNRLIINEQTRNCFEYFITQYGEKNIEQIKLDFKSYIQTVHKDPAQSQILGLWNRYIDYRIALGDLQASSTDRDSTQYYRAIFNKMKNLRQQFFSAYEIEGLFGTENIYHQYTLDRMDILDDKNLSESEKAQKLKELFKQLPQDWQDNLEQLNKLEDLRKLTADIQARGGSSDEIRQMRLNLVGPEATQRLERLDTERDDWKSRVNQYLSARDHIKTGGMGEAAKDQAIQQLRQQYFNNAQEQLRVETFETVHDQGGKLPFAN
ncbi:lipase secretion chaperone [Acinetobacter radioresistens]|uniref:lipase secretion chaperone n=1 Tax=Acinetobacter radioresistens TaxID=40216 RepID=UPI002245E68C|nr:lipase secretion chaperone [Acinetobacter radioresistens]MCX0339038.1 lipase secretion chaperone [Acinetobacter radioresistens]